MEDSEAKSASATNHQTEQVCGFFRKVGNKKNLRKKRTIENEDNEDDSNNEDSLMHVQRKNMKSSASAKPNEESKKPSFHFESSKEIQVQHDSKATATLETETDFSRDARERALKQATKSLKGTEDVKLYKGINNYTDHKAGFRREQTIASEKAGGSHGPLRPSAHTRVSSTIDYQPDVCKDFKETGYCGYGDLCKFLHDRTDYKSGWQLEKEWNEDEIGLRMQKRRVLADGVFICCKSEPVCFGSVSVPMSYLCGLVGVLKTRSIKYTSSTSKYEEL